MVLARPCVDVSIVTLQWHFADVPWIRFYGHRRLTLSTNVPMMHWVRVIHKGRPHGGGGVWPNADISGRGGGGLASAAVRNVSGVRYLVTEIVIKLQAE